jgi:hypothetical protein
MKSKNIYLTLFATLIKDTNLELEHLYFDFNNMSFDTVAEIGK